MSTRHACKFQRLSEVAIFCAVCGEIKVADPEAQCTRPHYPNPYWWWQPYTVPTSYPWTVTTETFTTGDVGIGSTYAASPDDTNVTYTLSGGTA